MARERTQYRTEKKMVDAFLVECHDSIAHDNCSAENFNEFGGIWTKKVCFVLPDATEVQYCLKCNGK